MPSKPFCAALTLIGISLAAASAEAQTLAGRATAINGDSILISGERVRLWAVDAPEPEQLCWLGDQSFRCGADATHWLAEFLAGKNIICEMKTYDGQRSVAACRAAGQDVGRELVRAGWALSFSRYGLDYVSAESEARAKHRGMWNATFSPPWDWRATHPR